MLQLPVVKLPKARTLALVADGVGVFWDPGHGRLMKEWIAINENDARWLELAKEARSFVGGG